ncbi:MAG: hypothetical protein ACFFDH_09870 [Promethearchaeota archaeon]
MIVVWDLDRINRICKLLEEKWIQAHDQRLGQFLRNFVFNRDEYPYMFDQDDEITEERLKNLDIELLYAKTKKQGIFLEDLKKDNFRSLKE